jgi:CRISPR-associated protein Cas2
MILVLITYDVSTETEGGKRRLRRVAKILENRGQRVQNSVFECLLDPAQLATLRADLEAVIDKDKDSLRYYHLGKRWARHVDHVGAKPSYDPQGPLVL